MILLHPDDLARLGLQADTPVLVRSEVGAQRVIARAFDKIKPGNVLMYYPEANVLVPRDCDPASRTPAFKHVAVTLEPVDSAGLALAGGDQPQMAGQPGPRGNMRAC